MISSKTREILYMFNNLKNAKLIIIGGAQSKNVWTKINLVDYRKFCQNRNNDQIFNQKKLFFSKFRKSSIQLQCNQCSKKPYIRTGQKYEWLVQFCIFCFVFVWLDQSAPSKVFWLVHFCKKCFLARPYKRPPTG